MALEDALDLERVAQLAGTTMPGGELLVRRFLSELRSSSSGKEDVSSQAAALARFLTSEILRPEQPLETHATLLEPVCRVACPQAGRTGPVPLWFPSRESAAATNLARFMSSFQCSSGAWPARRSGCLAKDALLLQQLSCSHPEEFWSQLLLKELQVVLYARPARMLADAATPDAVRWLPGARLNIADAALRCTRALPGAPALVWACDGAATELHSLTLEQLRQRCFAAAAAIRGAFSPGDALALDLPMTAESIIVYLAIVLAGCAVVAIAESFSSEEIAARLRISNAKAIFTQDVIMRGGKPLQLYAKVVQAAECPRAIVLAAAGGGSSPRVQSLRPGDITWQAFLAGAAGSSAQQAAAAGAFTPHAADPDDTTAILFSSGTTGTPKAILWTHVTPLRCATDGWAHQDIQPGNVVAWPTSLGWMMGPWLIYAALLNGAAVALYEGGPQGRDFGAFVAAARVTQLGLVPSLVKAWRTSGCMAGLDWSSIRCFSSTGEASAPDDYHWLMARVRGYRPVIEYMGGTELGGGYISGSLLQPQCPATFSMPTLGCRWVLTRPDDGRQFDCCSSTSSSSGSSSSSADPSGCAASGEVMLVPPMLGSSQRLLGACHAAAYYHGMPTHAASGRPLRRHGDEMARLPGLCYWSAMGRCDDTMNLGGIKVSSVEIERVVAAHVAEVAECAAVGVPPAGGGPELLYLFVVLQGGQIPQGGGAASVGRGPEAGSSAAVAPQQGQQRFRLGGGSNKLLDAALLRKACQVAIARHLSPLFKVHAVVVTSSLPRTASNKVMRRTLRAGVMAATAAQMKSKL